jgi:hypothetical protein
MHASVGPAAAPPPPRTFSFLAGALVGALAALLFAPSLTTTTTTTTSPHLGGAGRGGAGSGVPASASAASSAGTGAGADATSWRPEWWDAPAVTLEAPACSAARMRTGGESGWPSFLEVVSASGTDKGVNAAFPPGKAHEYAPLYARHLGPLRDRELNVLEIGLGCGMPVEGASIALWRRYLPCAKLFMMELHDCIGHYEPQLDGAARGDQSKPEELRRALALATPLHVIIDDGGHSMLQQVVTMREAMRVLPPGGLLVIEDLVTSWLRDFQDLPEPLEGRRQSAHRFITDVIEHLHRAFETPELYFMPSTTMDGAREVARLTLSVDCIREACVFTRNDVPADF